MNVCGKWIWWLSAALVAGALGVLPAAGATSPAGQGRLNVGFGNTCFVTSAGAAKCWGGNRDGQLGDGTTSTGASPIPTDVSGLSHGVAQIALGTYNACALTSGGAVECWGSNTADSLGDGSTKPSYTPVPVKGLSSGVASISGSCAVLTDGTAKCWGWNSFGVLGNGSTGNSPVPVTVSLSHVAAIAEGDGFRCAVTSAGAVDCWGRVPWSQTISSTPVPISGLAGPAIAVAAGVGHACALLRSGEVECWGQNYDGQLGDGTATASTTPVPVSGLSGVVQIDAGNQYMCALTNAGAVKCWGSNYYGQLGDGEPRSESPHPLPVAVSGLSSGVVALSGGIGGGHTCALLGGDNVKCWGWNNGGALGDGTTKSASTPVSVQFGKAQAAGCVVPALAGKTLAAVKTALQKSHCALGKVTRSFSTRVRAGRVISQSPAAGKHLSANAAVRVVLSKGKKRR